MIYCHGMILVMSDVEPDENGYAGNIESDYLIVKLRNCF